MKLICTLISCLLFTSQLLAQSVSQVWVPDNGDGTFKNPVLNADYSDPDVVRVGEDFYLVSSSFSHTPGLPLLHSRDLVNWRIIGHALPQQVPPDNFNKVQHGNGVWAPSIRYHNNEFYIYYPDPDFGIYLTKAKNISGPWSVPVLVQAGKGLIDPCPLWDDDGKVYLVHAFAGSRAGFKSIIVIKQLNAAGDLVTDNNGVLVYDGHETDPTIEGPKFYKRNGYYYIFAPAGGVSTGWQLVLRSKNIYGPYERKVVMDQGSTTINGPHQGAWINTASGEDWFMHFQDKDAYGRVVHLQPMKWVNDWPVIGLDKDGDGKGEPVMVYKKPAVKEKQAVMTPAESDEFNAKEIGLQWQWQANPQPGWAIPFPSKGVLRLNAQLIPDSAKSMWDIPSLLSQKFPAETFSATVKFDFNPKMEGDKAGLMVMGYGYAGISLVKKGDSIYIVSELCNEASKGNTAKETVVGKINAKTSWLKLSVIKPAVCSFSYSTDGMNFTDIPGPFTASPGRWVGAVMGIYCSAVKKTNDAGYVDMDWFRVGKF